MSLCRVLTELGAYPVLKRGRPRLYDTPEDAHKVARAQMNVAEKRRRLLKKEAIAAGEPEPVFKMGRPSIYSSPEEAEETRKIKNKACIARHKENVKQAAGAFLANAQASRTLIASTSQE